MAHTDEHCQCRSPKVGIPCQRKPHAERTACTAQGNEPDGVHWTVTWFRPGRTGDARADGLPWPRRPLTGGPLSAGQV